MGKTTISMLFKILKENHGIECGEALTQGNSCKFVFRSRRGQKKLVVKIGLDEKGTQEIEMNRLGYQEMREIGVSLLLPDPLIYIEELGIPMIVMGDCGSDFLTAVKEAREPLTYYKWLVSGIYLVHKESLQSKPGLAIKSMKALRDYLILQYQRHLADKVDLDIVEKLRGADFENLHSADVCFANFDFTPEDVFVTAESIKYADPKPKGSLLGIPVVDMACFAGTARDAHHLPASDEGYEILSDYALNVLAPMLKLTQPQAQGIFYFGNALQNALSCRFRQQREPERASEFARVSYRSLTRCLKLMR